MGQESKPEDYWLWRLEAAIQVQEDEIARGQATAYDLQRELAALTNEVDDIPRVPIELKIGSRNIFPKANAQLLAKFYLILNASILVLGAALIVFSSQQEIGVGLLVGGLFALGAMLSQLWVVVFENERDRTEQEMRAKRQQALAEARQKASEIIQGKLSANTEELNKRMSQLREWQDTLKEMRNDDRIAFILFALLQVAISGGKRYLNAKAATRYQSDGDATRYEFTTTLVQVLCAASRIGVAVATFNADLKSNARAEARANVRLDQLMDLRSRQISS